ncbi:Aste57867_7708 [Aphanomyces stellatus]|uniref:Aste57867_7708 protein n=1 Tax=Aphanomyces stellatus TaxID=120398 RepID=A0A485KIN8_9STRA|nr:hypothetical protein As57867_007679 [Aphanomyces stellatus]VFT84611.1 Aste57867_7708 [Aphanomyces stellatus]
MWDSKRADSFTISAKKMSETKPPSSMTESVGKSAIHRDERPIDDDLLSVYHEASMAMSLPEPYVSQLNKKFLLVEDFVQLTTTVIAEPFEVKPLGYYKTPDGFDIYVFECSLGSPDRLSMKKRWKIQRRYRHFDLFLSKITEVAPSFRVPSLSGSYLQMFRAKHCKDRLVELHLWLTKTVEMLQKSPAASDLHMLLCCFLFAGANMPYVTFASLPQFAWADEEINIRLTSTPLYPSKVRSSIETEAGIGIRLIPYSSRMEGGNCVYHGASVKGFLRDHIDSNIQHVRLGSKLARLNGVSIEDEDFSTILLLLRNVARPMHLTFTFDPRPQFNTLTELELRRHNRVSSLSSLYSNVGSSMDATEVQTPMNVLGSVLNETFGRKRTETISVTSEEPDNQDEEVVSWDEVGGFFMDTVTTGFFARVRVDKSKQTPNDVEGVWSTPVGPMSVLLTACKLRGREAVFLSMTPKMFLKPNNQASQTTRRNKKPEMRLERGMVLVSVNKKSTCGLSFAETMNLVDQASLPTALCFRWFNEYSLFISPNIDAADSTTIHRPSSMSERDISPSQSEMTCLVEAQARMCAMLTQALNENASLRSEIHVVQESNRLLREDNIVSSAAYQTLKRHSDRMDTRCNALQSTHADLAMEVQQTAKERQVAENAIMTFEQKLKKHLDNAREISRKMLLEHEARCIEESRKSIEVAKKVAEARAKRQGDEALAALRRQNNVDMQRLAEDNGEEIEFLNQQLALWKHQVEVLTENEKRKRTHELMPKMSGDDMMFMDEELDRRAGARVRSPPHVDDSKDIDSPNDQSIWDRVFDSPNSETP